ncbi:MAG: L-seryl-tRNA(Sec) selenium transferase [Candidatus Cloacimonetes bacterium]|jgi:L-seryl-tRNA(Ser) seleniumtransferase|nr:L-seryl-tRNA(Sec) selenium transferase [Candidatus Cloacimonadota bacterium]MBT6993642.1 L-seryl-tRNA(Sec) selenium transferase [Candidatus Cloacimonadota bacterium]MBT7470099.1 L-seryl-tRNA(Sec) selenium transferase [Candidatus Cloacimonadota bacterium]
MKEKLRKIPSVDKLLLHPNFTETLKKYGHDLLKFAIREVLKKERENILNGKNIFSDSERINRINNFVNNIAENSLKPVINASGIILHTNLARALLGKNVLKNISPIIENYSNLEFDLQKGKRGHRNTHISKILKFITKAEDAVVVNNNAAAVMLILKTFASNGEAMISRGELVEIGGSFRIPDIMDASGAKMVEVGTTNRTRISDYENAITKDTKIILKAHKSNYFIGGFTEEVELEQLVRLAKKHNLIFIYDMGSGLLRKPKGLPLQDEPDVQTTLKMGVDIVSFSGDKLLGGPQAGIIAGKEALILKLAKAPMMRALRVGKLTMAALISVLKSYLNDEKLTSEIPIFEMMSRNEKYLLNLAEKLTIRLSTHGINSEVIDSEAQVGGGTLPHLKLNSKAVKIVALKKSAKEIHHKLLQLDRPILAILRGGDLLFDVQTIFENEIDYIAEMMGKIEV